MKFRLGVTIVLVLAAAANVWIAADDVKLNLAARASIAKSQRLQEKAQRLIDEANKLMLPPEMPDVPESELNKYDVLHVPHSGKCPAHFTLAPDIFQRNGASYPACLRDGGARESGGLTDYLLPGESERMTLTLPQMTLPAPRVKL